MPPELGAVLAVSLFLTGCATPVAKAPRGVAVPAAAAPVEAAAPLAVPVLPFARSFASVSLPGDTGPLVSISGRARTEIWVLSEGGELIQLDGGRLVRRHKPTPCLTTNAFGWVGVSVDGDELRLLGSYQDPQGRLLSATFDRSKGVTGTCGASAAFTRLDCPWHHAWGMPAVDGRMCNLGGIALPDYDPFVPEEGRVKLQFPSVTLRGSDDGWLVATVGEGSDQRVDLHRYNGVTWVRVARIDQSPDYADLWADDAGRAWVLVEGGLHRFDGKDITRIAVPSSFAAKQIRAAGPDAVWFVGAGKKVFEWDGTALREGEAPFEPTEAWAGPGSELWIIGEQKDQLAHTTKEGAPR